jgi:hypothetical protein
MLFFERFQNVFPCQHTATVKFFVEENMWQAILRFAHSFPRALTRVHPLCYLGAYLLVIPTFAIFYWLIPAGFHAPYSRLEEGGKLDAQKNAGIVQTAIHRRIISTSAKPHQSFGTWKLDDSPSLAVVRTDDAGRLLFTLNIFMRDHDTPRNSNLIEFSLGASMTQTGRWNNHRVDDKRKFFRYLAFDKDELAEKSNMNRDISDFGARLDSELREIEVTETEEQTLQHFFAGISGNPVEISGSPLRMLYFSAMVITTVGFGDIVPISPIARLLVALESVGGIALFALFVNAIAWRAANQR